MIEDYLLFSSNREKNSKMRSAESLTRKINGVREFSSRHSSPVDENEGKNKKLESVVVALYRRIRRNSHSLLDATNNFWMSVWWRRQDAQKN